MKQSSFRRALPLAAFLLLLASTAHARMTHVRHHPKKPTAATPQVLVDGIVGGVVDQLWRQTDRYWHGGDYPRIIALDRIITQADPQFLEAYATGGWLMESLGRMEDAQAFYTRGTMENPHAAYAYWNLGFFLFNTKHDYPAAALVFQDGTRQAGADLNDWKMLAHAQEKAGAWDEAVGTWHAIKARYPNGLSVDRLLAEAQEKRRQAQAGAKPEEKSDEREGKPNR